MFVFADPCHPGPFVREEILAPRALNVTTGANALGVTRPALSALLNARADLSPEMAVRIEKAFGISMEILLKMQLAYDIAKVRRMAKSIHVKKWSPAKTKSGAPKRAASSTKSTKTINR
jgi:addiction module HigA family antidote